MTAVYTLQNLGEAGDLLLEDHGNQMQNEAPVDAWDRTNQAAGQDRDNSNPPITQANERCEFVPESSNVAGSITSGYGELINRQSGLVRPSEARKRSPGSRRGEEGSGPDDLRCEVRESFSVLVGRGWLWWCGRGEAGNLGLR